MALPKDFVEEFYPAAEGVSILGKPLNSLTRKELAASVVFLVTELEDKRAVLNQLSTYMPSRPYAKSH